MSTTGDGRVHPRLRRRDPDRHREERVERRAADPEAAEAEERAEQCDGERREGKGLGVCEGDHEQHADVVGDDDGEDESAESLGRPAGPRARAPPDANAVSVAITIPHPCAASVPPVNAR